MIAEKKVKSICFYLDAWTRFETCWPMLPMFTWSRHIKFKWGLSYPKLACFGSQPEWPKFRFFFWITKEPWEMFIMCDSRSHMASSFPCHLAMPSSFSSCFFLKKIFVLKYCFSRQDKLWVHFWTQAFEKFWKGSVLWNCCSDYALPALCPTLLCKGFFIVI